MGLPYNNNPRFDNLTPQFAIPSKNPVYNLVNSQTTSQRTVIHTSGRSSMDIIFPLPTNLNYKKYYQWQAKDTDFLKDKAAKLGGSLATKLSSINSTEKGKAVFNELMGDAGEALMDGIDMVKNMSGEEATNAALYLLQKKYGSDIEMVNYNMNRAVNPLKKLYFQGMDLRTFDFNFDIIPQNKEENERFLSSYRSLRSAATPEINPDKIFYQYPMKFRVEIYTADSKLIFGLGNLCCVNAGFNINEMKFRSDGLPMVYNLSLTFQESEIADRTVENSSGLMI